MRNEWKVRYEVDESVIRELSEFIPHWRHKCDAEKRRLLASHEDATLEFEHIGSTSVNGLGSRTIIDTGVMSDRTEGGVRRGLYMERTQFDTIIARYPTLSGLVGQLRSNAHFRRFEEGLASTICGSSYVIPFVSDSQCLVTRRSNGKWVLPGGTLESGETWEEAGRRELMEETGSILGDLHPIGMYFCVSQSDKSRLSHFPHPEHVRVVSWANVVQNAAERSDPDPDSSIVEVRTVHYKRAAELFGAEAADYGELYLFAHEMKRSICPRS